MLEIWQKYVVYVIDKYKQAVLWSFPFINVNSKNSVDKKMKKISWALRCVYIRHRNTES
jgi:hypothetical protein